MTSDVVNLNRVRKARERADREKQATVNRVDFGRTKEERAEADVVRLNRDRLLDGARRTNARPEDDDPKPGSAS